MLASQLTDMLRFLLILACSAIAIGAQAPPAAKPFKVTAELGVPIVIGAESFIIGSKEKIETASERELTLTSADLAISFPNRQENIVAAAGEKLLILRGSIRNPEKTTVTLINSTDLIGLRLWQAYKGTGKFKFVAHFDPAGPQYIRKELKPGESAKFISVWRIPSDFMYFRLGLMYYKPQKLAWYNLTSTIGKIHSAFADVGGLGTSDTAKVAAGETFDFGALEIRAGTVSEPEMIAGMPKPAAGHRYVVNLAVTNRQMLPSRWGWQYFTVELIGSGGTVLKAYPDIIDQATGRSWYGDLNAGASLNARFLFNSVSATAPRALRLTMLETGRTVEVALVP